MRACVLLALSLACGPKTIVETERPLTFDGPLVVLAPISARYVVTARLRELFAAPSFRRVADPLFTGEWHEHFARRTGVDIPEVHEVMFATLDEGGFLIAARIAQAPEVVVAAGMRMTSMEVQSDEPFVRRVGFLGTERREFAAIGEDLLLVGADAGEEIAAILDGVRGRSAPSPALSGRDAARLIAFAEDAPLVLFAPKPLQLPIESGIGMLLARERAAAIAILPEEQGLFVRAIVVGELPPGGDDNLQSLFASLAETDLGQVLGINQAIVSLVVEVRANDAELSCHWPVETLARGLRLLFTAELDAIVEEAIFAR